MRGVNHEAKYYKKRVQLCTYIEERDSDAANRRRESSHGEKREGL